MVGMREIDGIIIKELSKGFEIITVTCSENWTCYKRFVYVLKFLLIYINIVSSFLRSCLVNNFYQLLSI